MEEKQVVIYMENWQKRLVGNIYGEKMEKCNELAIPVPSPPIMLYGVWPIPPKPGYRLYFTDWQKRVLDDAGGIGCDFIELDPERPPILMRYGLPTD